MTQRTSTSVATERLWLPTSDRYLGPLSFPTGHCNTAPLLEDPEAGHARCTWVLVSSRVGWRSCPCDCHPTGHEANMAVRDAIKAQEARILDEMERVSARRLENEMADEKTKERKPRKSDPKECLCGCGGTTKGGRFLPGHDAKLKSQLMNAYRAADTDKERRAIAGRFEDLGWAKFIPTLTDDDAGNGKAAKKATAKRTPKNATAKA